MTGSVSISTTMLSIIRIDRKELRTQLNFPFAPIAVKKLNFGNPHGKGQAESMVLPFRPCKEKYRIASIVPFKDDAFFEKKGVPVAFLFFDFACSRLDSSLSSNTKRNSGETNSFPRNESNSK